MYCLGLSVANMSHDQFEACHWSTVLPYSIYIPPPQLHEERRKECALNRKMIFRFWTINSVYLSLKANDKIQIVKQKN